MIRDMTSGAGYAMLKRDNVLDTREGDRREQQSAEYLPIHYNFALKLAAAGGLCLLSLWQYGHKNAPYPEAPPMQTTTIPAFSYDLDFLDRSRTVLLCVSFPVAPASTSNFPSSTLTSPSVNSTYPSLIFFAASAFFGSASPII